MADFLTRLAERTLRTVPVAQPIIASMFAPQQFMTASIQETASWRSACAAPIQDAASALRAEAVTTIQGKPDDHASLHLEQDAMVEANSVAGDRVDPNQPEMNRPGTVSISRSPIQLASDTKSTMYRSDPSPNEMPTAISIRAADLQERADQSAVGGIGAIRSLQPADPKSRREASLQAGFQESPNRPLLTVGEDVHPNTGANLVAENPGLSVRQPEFPAFAEEVGGPDSIEAQFIAPSVSSPQAIVTNRLPAATGQLPEEAETSEMAAKELIPTTQARVLRLAPASGMSSRQGEPLALEQEETVSPQPVADHNNLVPLALAEQISMSLMRDTSFNPLVEKTFDSIVASHPQTVSPKTNMVGAPLAGALPGPAPTLHEAATRATNMVGAPLAGVLPGPVDALPELHNQGHAVPPTGDQKGNKAAASRPQPPSTPRTTEQVDVLPVEQRLLVLQAQVPQENVPQQQTDASLINIFTPGLRRNQSQSRSSLAQHDQAVIRQGPVTALPVESVPTAPSIHITIGRIDVRAVTSPVPAPPSKPARPSPLLSLDDYLKQSKGGGQ